MIFENNCNVSIWCHWYQYKIYINYSIINQYYTVYQKMSLLCLAITRDTHELILR